jgi:hypothetical protein
MERVVSGEPEAGEDPSEGTEQNDEEAARIVEEKEAVEQEGSEIGAGSVGKVEGEKGGEEVQKGEENASFSVLAAEHPRVGYHGGEGGGR